MNQSSVKHLDPSQTYHSKMAKWTSNDNFLDSDVPSSRRGLATRYNDSSLASKRNKSLFTRVPTYNSESTTGNYIPKYSVKETTQENNSPKQNDDLPAYITPVKLTLSRNTSKKSQNADTETNIEDQKSFMTPKSTFKQQIINQAPKLVNF